MKVGIVIDDWKLPIFERHLKQGGFMWEQHPGVTDDTLLLSVETAEPRDLMNVTKQANTEAAMKGRP